ncbi:hypothetical protein KUTeg_002200 [Tegillarca granosa]|uniref:RING-type domain-containing protein n=1 Tax=Tegillarca granosa TaxID=220873 RepID=A0ABQ9FTM4_TEGGR|nr:hypothetical protein KUTeg_002200 [Tegillarca granosa]
MRVQCCICSDLFENDPTISISALQCGHVFHENCINQWLKNSNTCPSCRNNVSRTKIISKLYFDHVDEVDDGNGDSSKLINEVQSLKVQIRQNEKEKEGIREDKKSLEKKVKELQGERKNVEKLFKQEQSTNSSLRKQLHFFEMQQTALDIEKDECKRIKRKLVELQNVEVLLTGSEEEAKSILDTTGDGDRAVGELAKYCGMLKREYDQIKAEKKALKSEFEKCKRENISKDSKLKELTKETSILRDQYARSEDDLKMAEKEKDIMKKKLNHLKRAIKSPCPGGSSSFVETLLDESIMQSTPIRLNEPQNGDKDILLESQVIMTPEILKPSPTTQMKRQCEENDMKFVKISSACNQNPAKKMKKDIQDISNLTELSGFNILKKKSGLGDYNSVVRKGYDGLGGHMTFTQPQGKPKLALKKNVPVTSKTIKNNGKAMKFPPLPKLDNYF